jgi:hypothetical protein
MAIEILGIQFQFVCEVKPELDEHGFPKEYQPQTAYRNAANVPLNKYGGGSFCRFRIGKGNEETGVYAITVNDVVKYIGECEDLEKRWNNGYGNISPRNCFAGGRSTNCRINKLILETAKKRDRMALLFLKTDNRFEVEHNLIARLKPEWNMTTGKKPTGQKKLTHR